MDDKANIGLSSASQKMRIWMMSRTLAFLRVNVKDEEECLKRSGSRG